MFIHRAVRSLLGYPFSWKPRIGGLARRPCIPFRNFSSADSAPLPLKYVPIDEVEDLENYRAGGYHPILIGDVLQSRYRVAHKLGYRAYSTTWLCRDNQSDTYVVVKVGTAEPDEREVDILNHLSQSSPLNHPGRTIIPSVKDRFVLRGSNGTHPCYVTTLARSSVSSAKGGS